jgi:hypothetical protein
MISNLLIGCAKAAIVVGFTMAAINREVMPAFIGCVVAATSVYLTDIYVERRRRRMWREMFRRLDQHAGGAR